MKLFKRKQKKLMNILQAVELNRRAWERVNAAADKAVEELEKLNIGPAPSKQDKQQDFLTN